MKKPETVTEYVKWLKNTHKKPISKKTETYYNSVSAMVQTKFSSSDFWVELTGSRTHGNFLKRRNLDRISYPDFSRNCPWRRQYNFYFDFIE